MLLWAGFLVERLSVINWIRNLRRGQDNFIDVPVRKQIIGILVITLSEIVIWLIWYYVALELGHIIAFLIFTLLMQAEHAVEMAFLKREPWKKYFWHRTTLIFTLIETLGGALGLYFFMTDDFAMAAGTLFIGLSIEHIIQGVQLRDKL